MRIRLLKRTDGAVVLRCDRPDGSATWRRYEGANAQYLAVHDLVHYAVESVCGYRRGFYGLIAEGWSIGDFGTPWPRGRVPADAEPAELVVGFLTMEAVNGQRTSADELNTRLREAHQAQGLHEPPSVDDPTLEAIRREILALRARWIAAPPGSELELAFPLETTRST